MIFKIPIIDHSNHQPGPKQPDWAVLTQHHLNVGTSLFNQHLPKGCHYNLKKQLSKPSGKLFYKYFQNNDYFPSLARRKR